MRLARILAVTMLVAAACGGGSDDPAGDPSPVSPAEPSSQDPANVLAPSGDDPSDGPPATADPIPPPNPPSAPDDEPPAAEAPDLSDTTWLIGEYHSPDIGYTNTWIVDVTIEFAADGTVSGTAGCNDYQALWIASGPYRHTGSYDGGQDLVFEDLSWTERACDDDRVMTQEMEILGLLQDVGAWVLLEGELQLLNPNHELLAAAETTGRQLVLATSCEGDPTELEVGASVDGELTMGVDWPEPAYFCVEIADNVTLVTVTLSNLSADLDLLVAYPTLEALLNGLSDWLSLNFDTEDEVVFIDTGVADYVAPGSYYIEVSSGGGDVGSFTLTVTTE